MDYFSKFLRTGSSVAPRTEVDRAQEFHKSWIFIKNTLEHPDERQLSKGIKATEVPTRLQSMVDALVWESARTEEGGTGACLEYLLKNDVLGTLVKLSETDRPFGIQAEVLRSVQNMVVLLDEQFLVHSAVHKAVLRLLRSCVGDDLQEQLDGRNRLVGAAGTATRSQPSEYEEDLVNLLCILCSRIRHYRELLMIFFHDKQWYRPEPLFSVEEEDEDGDGDGDEDEDEVEEVIESSEIVQVESSERMAATTAEHAEDISSSQPAAKKPEYEFLLFNYLLRFVHREGKIGDFARSGLLFLMDVAMSQIEPVQKDAGDETFNTSSSTGLEHDPNADAALALAEYILDGDFSDVLAAGLAAVYSLLPTKLEIGPPTQSETTSTSGMILGNNLVELSEDEQERLEVERDKNRAMGMEDSSSSDFKFRLDHFLKLLEFLQDVLRRNVAPESSEVQQDSSMLVGSAIAQAILDAVRRVFLENVLYPSILECSDTDGSAVAVMSYIDIMVRTLQEGQLGELIVEFLTSEDNTEDFTRSRMRPRALLDLGGNHPPTAKSTRSSKLRRRKSAAMTLLEMEVPDARRPSEYFTSMGRFTLKDLLLSSLRSISQATVAAALQLFHTVLHQYCKLSTDKLLIVIRDPNATSYPCPAALPEPPKPVPTSINDDEDTFVYPGSEDTIPRENNTLSQPVFVQPDTTYWTHEREMGLYLSLVSHIDPNHAEDAFSTGYEHYLRDALISVQSQLCYRLDVDEETRRKHKHRLNPNDPIFSSILESLSKFFANTPELNMALTGILATLTLCPDRSLAGWLTFPAKEGMTFSSTLPQGFQEFNDDGDDRSVDWRIEQQLAAGSEPLQSSGLDERSRPVVYTIFQGLVAQLERYRQLVDDFDQFLLERRQGLLFSENLTDALTLALEFDGTQPIQRVVSPTSDSQSTLSTPRPKAKSKPSFVSFLTPRKHRSMKSQTSSSKPSGTSQSHRAVETSPFGPHYQKTTGIVVEPYTAPPPSDGPWIPTKPRKFTAYEEDVFASSGQWGDEERESGMPQEEEGEQRRSKPATITLSRLLDNVVILEESIKEIVAIIHARRTLGVDSIRYL